MVVAWYIHFPQVLSLAEWKASVCELHIKFLKQW